MNKSATEVMQEIVFSAVLDGIAGLKAASKGLPNTLLRDLNALHPNTTFSDLPPELQSAIAASVRSAFARLLKEGYSVSPGQPAPQRPAHAREGVRVQRGERRPPPRGGDAPKGRGPGRGPGAGPGGAGRPGGGRPGGGARPGGGRPGGGRSGPKGS
jgi:hypothetical protein